MNQYLKQLSILICLAILPFGPTYSQHPDKISTTYQDKLLDIFGYQEALQHVHPFVQYLYPVAIVQDGYFYVFDLTDNADAYVLTAWEETGMDVPVGVRAAFTLPFYDNRCACIVTGEVFDSQAGYVTIFHEFIHCHQWHTVEPSLREGLPLAVRMTEEGNYMWEMNYPFPYDDSWFVNTYTAFIAALDSGQTDEAMQLRQSLQTTLKSEDHQYMVWQEWKEGFALYIENLLRTELGMETNNVGRQTPYGRTVFYAGGEAYIKYLINETPSLGEDIQTLFKTMLQGNILTE